MVVTMNTHTSTLLVHVRTPPVCHPIPVDRGPHAPEEPRLRTQTKPCCSYSQPLKLQHGSRLLYGGVQQHKCWHPYAVLCCIGHPVLSQLCNRLMQRMRTQQQTPARFYHTCTSSHNLPTQTGPFLWPHVRPKTSPAQPDWTHSRPTSCERSTLPTYRPKTRVQNKNLRLSQSR